MSQGPELGRIEVLFPKSKPVAEWKGKYRRGCGDRNRDVGRQDSKFECKLIVVAGGDTRSALGRNAPDQLTNTSG